VAELVAKIDFAVSPQAWPELSVCGEAKFVAGEAKIRKGDGSNQTDHGPGGSIAKVSGRSMTPVE